MANQQFEGWMELAIRSVIEAKLKQITEEEIAKASQNIATRMREQLAGLILAVHQEYAIERGEHHLIIHVKNDIVGQK